MSSSLFQKNYSYHIMKKANKYNVLIQTLEVRLFLGRKPEG